MNDNNNRIKKFIDQLPDWVLNNESFMSFLKDNAETLGRIMGKIMSELVKELSICPKCKTPYNNYIFSKGDLSETKIAKTPIVEINICEKCGFDLESKEAKNYVDNIITEKAKILMEYYNINLGQAKSLIRILGGTAISI